jgi:hypothetical protein
MDHWYSNLDPYGDREKQDLIEWIKDNTPPEAVFIAEGPIARWIEGIGERRVLMVVPSQYLFMVGEQDRVDAAQSILLSRRGMRNGIVWIKDQAPSGYYQPLIAFRAKGTYIDALYIDSESSVSYHHKTSNSAEVKQFKDAICGDVLVFNPDENIGVIRSSFEFPGVEIVRDVMVVRDQASVFLSFNSNSKSEGVVLEDIVIVFKVPLDRDFYGVVQEGSGSIEIHEDDFIIDIISPQAAEFVQRRDGVEVHFQKFLGEEIKIEVTVKTGNGYEGMKEVEIYDSKELIHNYHAGFIVLPRRGYQFLSDIPVAKGYHHLLKSDYLEIVYENERVIVLRVT